MVTSFGYETYRGTNIKAEGYLLPTMRKSKVDKVDMLLNNLMRTTDANVWKTGQDKEWQRPKQYYSTDRFEFNNMNLVEKHDEIRGAQRGSGEEKKEGRL